MTGEDWTGPWLTVPSSGAPADVIAQDARALVRVLESLNLPKGTLIRGTRHGTEVHRKDGVSYIVRPIAPRVDQ